MDYEKIFENLPIKNSNNCEVLYPAIKKPKKLFKKKYNNFYW